MSSTLQLDPDEAMRIADTFATDIDNSRSAMEGYIRQVYIWRRCYQDDTHEKPMFPGGSTTHVPYVKAATKTITASLFPTLMNAIPLHHVERFGATSRQAADVLEGYYQALCTREPIDLIARYKETMFNGLRDGACVMRPHYRQRIIDGWQTQETTRTSAIALPGTAVSFHFEQPWHTFQRGSVAVYDGPDWEVIPIDRFGTIPVHDADVQSSGGVWVQHTIRVPEVLQYVQEGVLDKKATLRMLATEPDVSKQQTANDAKWGVYPMAPDRKDVMDGIRLAYTIYEIRYAYTPAIGTDVQEWTMFYSREFNTVLSAYPSRETWNARPFLLYRPYEVDRGIMGDSVASIGGRATETDLTQLRQIAINCMLRGMNPQRLIPASLFKAFRKEFEQGYNQRPGVDIPLPDTFFESGNPMGKIVPLMTGYNPTIAMGMIEYVTEEGNKWTGSSEASQGGNVQKGETATNAMLMEQGRKQLLGHVIEQTAAFMSKVARMTHLVCQQHHEQPALQALWEALQSEEGDGHPLRFEEVLFQPVTFSANGITEISNKAYRAEQAKTSFGVALQAPWVPMNAKLLYNVFEMMLHDGVDQRHPEDLIGTAQDVLQWQQQQQQQQAMQQQAAQQQAAPQAMPSGDPHPAHVLAGQLLAQREQLQQQGLQQSSGGLSGGG